jgi:F0F1-type ATP synthase assembly protein I
VFFSLFFNLNYKRHHASINIFLTLTTIVVNFALAYYYNRLIGLSNQFGILQWLPNVIMVICLSRFTFIGFNRSLLSASGGNKIKFLWRFHLIHHTDVWVDTTSGHHPGELVICFHNNGSINRRKPYVARFPIPNFVCNRYTFNHANIAMPKNGIPF